MSHADATSPDSAPTGETKPSPARARLLHTLERHAPLPGRRDPTAWSRNWILGASIALLIGGIVPLFDWEAYQRGPFDGSGTTLAWPWHVAAADRISWLYVGYPFAWAAIGFGSLALRGASRGALLVLGAVALVVADDRFFPREVQTLVAATHAGFQSHDGRLMSGAVPFAALGLLGVVVGNHLRKRVPTGRIAIVVTGFGGLLCLGSMPFLMSYGWSIEHTSGTIVGTLVSTWAWWQAAPMLVFGMGWMAFVLVGVRAFASHEVARRCAWTSRLARFLLVGHPLALFGLLSLDRFISDHRDVTERIALAARDANLFDGAMVLASTGLALWLESRMIRRAAKVNDATAL